MRILVVGATGGLGQDIVAEAVARGHETSALLRDPARVTFSEAVEIVRATSSTSPRSHRRSSGAMR